MKRILARAALFSFIRFGIDTGLAAETHAMDKYFSMSPSELAEITVTIASGTPQPNYQSAAVTSVITADQIKAMGATELHEVLETIPGVHATLQAITNEYHYSIRGINNPTNSQTLMLLNGTRVNTPLRGTFALGVELPIDAIKQIEVIRGPGSALYGADAFAGVINIVTKKARDIDGLVAGVRAGNWNTQSAWGQLGGHWAGWDVAASLQYQHTDGDHGQILQADSQTVFDTLLGTRASQAPGSMDNRYKLFNAHLNLERKYWDIGMWALATPQVGSRSGAAGALDPEGGAEGEQYLGDLRFSTEDSFVDWEWQAHASYLQADIHVLSHTFPDNALLPIGGNGAVNPRFPAGLVLFPDGTIDSVSQLQRIPSIELSSFYKGWTDHLFKASVGYRYEEALVNHLTNYGPGVFTAGLPVVQNGVLTDVTGTPFAFLQNTRRSVWSAALQDEWGFAERWQLTAGLRYDNYSDFGDTLNPRAALIWNASDHLTAKLMYGKAFRAPSFIEQAVQNNPVILGNKALKPELINTVETAIDYRPFASFHTAANLFYYHIENLIAEVAGAGTASAYANTGNQNGYGGELEWDWRITDQVNLKGNYSWQYSRNEVTKSRVAGVPEHQFYVAAAWKFLPQWQFQSQLNWIGGRARIIGDNRPLEDYATVDLTLAGKNLFRHVNVNASLRNLFNTRGREPAVIQIPENLPLPGRSFYLEASVHF